MGHEEQGLAVYGQFRMMITVMPLRTCRTYGAFCILFFIIYRSAGALPLS
jgi:hypothetical protein